MIQGTPGADISATKAWAIETGSKGILVAIIHSGVLYNHKDLKANIACNENGDMPKYCG